MSEGDVNLIRDEDVLRRMWQQTEDFGRKKEIRAHMYRLREERLRNLYSPEPTPAKGCEFSSGQAHVDSFADQTFQSMKSKEVRDAGSPPKEFNYRGQDLKELSNAGWNVESENRTTDDGRTHVKSVNANIEGRYDVEGGRGQFAAVDRQRQAVTEYQDDHTKLRRDETSSNTAAHEHVVRQTDDGTKLSSTTSSSNTSSKFQQVSSTVYETPAIQDYDQATHDTNRNEKVTKITNTEQTLRSSDIQSGDLVSRKIDYPDDNTKVIVETRCLPDGTRVTSTRREFRAPAQSSRSEYQTRSESKSYSSQQKSDTRESSSKTIRHTTDSHTDDSTRDSRTYQRTTDHTDDIVNSQRHVDDNDFKRQLREYTVDDDTSSEAHRTNRRYDTRTSKVTDHSKTEDDFSQTRYVTRVNNKVDRSTNVTDDYTQVHHETDQRFADNVDQTDRGEVVQKYDDCNVLHKDVKDTHYVMDTTEKTRYVTEESRRFPKDIDEPVRNTLKSEQDRNVPRTNDESSPSAPRDANIPRQDFAEDTSEQVHQVHKISSVSDEQTHKITRDSKMEDHVERKTSNDHYKTTYQNDFQQKKVSNDWSPTQQAWASTLRADTPSATRPSTRASSPGSRTFKSSTSSLRSSVSPDKNSRKSTSRGGSPSKVDRYSPTRSIISDRYTSTHSSHSVTEMQTNKYTSPERKPPKGRSPAERSPERKPQDSYRQRPSVSPEKRSQNVTRPSASPERKPSHKKRTDSFPKSMSPTRAAGLPSGPRQSPERQPYQPSSGKTCPDSDFPKHTSPHRPSTSPESRKPPVDSSKPVFPRNSSSPDRKRPIDSKKQGSPEREVGYKQPTHRREPQDSNKRTSVSPDKKPSYMRPTAASQPISDLRRNSKPTDEPRDNSPFEPSQSPDRKYSKTTQVKEDHYKFIDQETKVNTKANTRTDKTHSLPSDKAHSPSRKSPNKDTSDFAESPLPKGRSPSPQKKTVIVTENDELYGRIDKTVELVDITTTHDEQTKESNTIRSFKDSSESKRTPSRETSPNKFGTYDKKKPRDIVESTEIATTTSTKDVNYDSLNRRDKTSPKKTPESTSPTKKSPRDSTSPMKSPTRDTKYKRTTDFISTERTSEEVNKKTTKERPRQLQTPSSSPTRKPKVENEPSTGQSSPTTSVSGFVYFGSPRTEQPIVTDLDDDYQPTTCPDENPCSRPDTLELTRSTSPSKIPCRPPSHEKRESPTKDSLPRKSSLKKPSSYANPASPMDKPPSSFRVSPTEDKPDITSHKIIKKDHPSEPESSSPTKPKPPLTRRETYEDRCRLILGMVNTENVTEETKRIKKLESDKSSPSVSPCESPILQEPLQFPDFQIQDKIVNTKSDVIEFITKEQENIINTSKTPEKIPSRESSPTKLQDIVSKTTTVGQIDSTTQKKVKDVTTITEIKIQSPRQSPEKTYRRPSESPERQIRRTPTHDNRVSEIPKTETSDKYDRGTSPTKLPRLSVSPERKQPTSVKDSSHRQAVDKSKDTSPSRAVNTTVSNKTITSQNTEFEDFTITEDIQEDLSTTTKEKSTRTRILKSPTRQAPTTEPASKSPSGPCSSPIKDNLPTNPSFEIQSQKDSLNKKPNEKYPEKESPTKPRESLEKTPGYVKSATTISSKYETSSTTEGIEETTTSTTDKKHTTTKTCKSPTRRNSQDVPRSVSPTKPGVDIYEHSPEHKLKDVPVKSTEPKDSSSHGLPGYMKTTASATSKNETMTIIENVSESITSKITDQKHQSLRTLESPTRKASVPRTPSPTKISQQPSVTTSPKKIDTPSVPSQPLSQNKGNVPKKPKDSLPQNRSPTRPASDKVPSYMKTTTSVSSKYETTDEYDITEDTQESITSKTTKIMHPKSKQSPNREPSEKSTPEYPRSGSPTKPTDCTPRQDSPERRPGNQLPSRESPKKEPQEKYPEESSPTFETKEYINTTDKTSQFDITSTTEDSKTTISIVQKRPLGPKRDNSRTYISPERKPGQLAPAKDSTTKSPQDKPVKKTASTRPSASPDRKPSYMKPTSAFTSRHEISMTNKDIREISTSDSMEHKHPSPRTSPTRQSPQKIQKDNSVPKPEEPSRTPSPTKMTMKVTEVSTDFLMSEREQEILDRVHKSLRKLSPERKEKSPSREKSSNKTTTSLSDLDITTESVETYEVKTEDVLEEQVSCKTDKTRPEKPNDAKPKDQQTQSKPSSRNISPIKRAPSVPTSQVEKSPESPTKSRSISPRKPLSQTERPQSPHGARASGIRPRDQVPFNRKPTPATLSTYRIEKVITDVKKTNGVTKQNVLKTSSTSKSTTSKLISPQSTKPNEPESKRIPTPKENPKKETVTRTSSDSNIKPKKASPQRMKSKPEIHVNDLSTKSPKYQKPIIKEPHSKLPAKPKSATALNTSTEDDDDIIIDVQQSKSSRENSPDRICPTPVNFADDVGTPRFPDEVSEPDDEYRRRTYHTIHETESVVDDIVEICEDEELFVKKTDVTSKNDDSLLSVNDKVSKFTSKIESVTKPKDTTNIFKDVEKRVHSDFVDENIKSDECLLSVSEKVNKFAKGPRDTKDNRSPSRKITDEYDRHTIYQDDYTKLSVNDKAHLFVETAESIKVPKVKPAQKVDRPDLSNVDESLRKDDCLLSVSDKVNKFVKTAENFLTETHEVDQKEKKIMEQHDKIIRQIVDETDEDESYKIYESTTAKTELNVEINNSKPITEKKEATPQPNGPKSKPTERTPTVKITTLRSSEAVKKAKALFENIASTQKTKDVSSTTSKTIKLTDIGVVRKSPKTDSTTVLHTSVEDVSPTVTDVDSELNAPHTSRSTERPTSGTLSRPRHHHVEEKPRASPNRLTAQTPEVPRAKSPMRQSIETTTTRTVLTRYPTGTRAESPRNRPESPRYRPESDKSDKVPGYLRPTKTSQIKEETKIVEESDVSSRRGSGKFGVELRRTSIERSTVSSERRRSVEHHQPCIEDIFDLDLLEQMLEKVVGYEQRRRIRSQIRVVKNDTEHVETHTHIKTKHTTSSLRSKTSERQNAKSPERLPKTTPQKALSPERQSKTLQRTHPERNHPKEPTVSVMNGHSKEPVKPTSASRLTPHSPEKPAPKSIRSAKSPARQPSPVKKRTVSPTKTTAKPKSNRFNEYASAYMKKIGMNDTDKKFADKKTKKATETKRTVSHETQDRTSQEFTTTKSFTATSERTSSRDVIEIVQVNGKRTPSPEKVTGILRKPQSPERRVYSPVGKTHSPERDQSTVSKAPERRAHSPEQRVYSPVSKTHVFERKATSPERKVYSPIGKLPERKASSPERKAHSPDRKAQSPERKVQSPESKVLNPAERLYQRTPSPEFKRQKSDTKKETIIKTVYDIEKKITPKPVQEEKPSWVTNRNLKKITSETRTFSTKKLETEKPKYRATSPSKVISKPIDVITSSYGPGPLDADGRPLFGIKALRNGATNFQVKGTVIRQEFHSRNGGEPEGTVSVTAYSSQPEELEQLLAAQGAEPPSRIHGLSAITTTKKFGGDTGISMSSVNTKEERASLEQFTHTDRKMESQIDNLETCSYDTQQEVIDSRKSDRTDRSDRRKEERVTEVRKGQREERREKMERREDKKTVRQSSVKSLTEKFIKSANDSGKTDRSTYPKAGLILRTTSTLRDSVSSDEAHPALARTDSEHSMGSVEDVVVTKTTERGGAVTTTTRTSRHHGPTTTHQRTSTVTHHEPIITTKKTTTVITGSQEPVVTRVVTQGPVVTKTVTGQRQGATVTERSFLDSSTKVTGVQDILTRMKNADIVIEDGDSVEDSEARALLNKFLGATVLMAGMQGYVSDQPAEKLSINQETVRTSSGKVSSTRAEDIDLEQCWDERLLRKLLDECTDYDQRRRLRARIRTLMAEQEACAAAVTDALGAAHIAAEPQPGAESGAGDPREEEEVTVTTSVRRDSSEKSSSSSTTKTSKVIESVSRPAPKPVSPFAKFRQLEKQNSTNSPNPPQSPQSPRSPSQPYFKFTDPALQCSALTIKERLLQWCRDKTRDYENVKLENFSTSWADGLAFCALLHHFLPDAFDYSRLTPDQRRHNFTLAFKLADEKAGIYPLLDVDDMVAMRKPDWKCVFTYVQAIYRRFKDEP